MAILVPHRLFPGSRGLLIFLAISSIFIMIPFFAVRNDYIAITCDGHEKLQSWHEKYESQHPEDLNEVLRILQTTPNLWGYRGLDGPRNDTIATRITAQQEWVQQISATTFIKNVKRKKILVYLEPLEGNRYWFTKNRLKCPYAPEFQNKCDLVLENRNWQDHLKHHPPQSYYSDLKVDAVIGIQNGYWGDDQWYSEPTLPPNVQQIYYVFESPCHTGSARLGRNRAWLSSYWRGADIPIPYRQFIKIPSKSNNSSNNTENGSIDVIKDSRKLVAAMISNCNFVHNNRMGYIRALQQYIPVDVFGKCGRNTNNTCPNTGDCLEHLGSRYKFYLAFENCNCEDYISEKFFVNALQHNMVPVVMGAARENYDSAAPPNSFIHVNDFSSPKELAQYLQLLDNDDELYQKYVKWKIPQPSSGFGWELSTISVADFFCRACGLLYYADFKPPPPYPSCFTRWKDLNKCLTKNVWRWP